MNFKLMKLLVSVPKLLLDSVLLLYRRPDPQRAEKLQQRSADRCPAAKKMSLVEFRRLSETDHFPGSEGSERRPALILL